MKLIDISHVLNENTPIYPGDAKTTLTEYRTLGKDQYRGFLLRSCLHTGTHVDLPTHLIPDSRLTCDFPLERFMGKGVLLDVRGEHVISMKKCYEQAVTQGSIVLLFTGFDRHYKSSKYFSSHPVVEDALAKFLLSKDIKMLGMDTPAPDYAPHALHKELLKRIY